MERTHAWEGRFDKPLGCHQLQLLAFAPRFSVWLLFIFLCCFCYTESIVLGLKGLKGERMTQLVISIEQNLKCKGRGIYSTGCVGYRK